MQINNKSYNYKIYLFYDSISVFVVIYKLYLLRLCLKKYLSFPDG